MKIKIVIIILLVFLFNTIFIYAAPTDDIYEEEISSVIGSSAMKESLIAHIHNVKSDMLAFSVTQESKLYLLSELTKMYKDLYYLAAIEELSVSNQELAELAVKIRIEADAYVKKYSEDSKILISEIDIQNTVNIKETLTSELKQILEYEIPALIEAELEPVLTDPVNKTSFGDYDYTAIISRYQETLYWSNEILNSLITYQNDLSSLKSTDQIFIDKIKMLLGITKAKQLMEGNPELKKLLEEAKRKQPSIKREAGTITVKQDIEYQLEALASVKRIDDWNPLDFSIDAWEIEGSQLQLEAAYIAMLASTSIYTPFRSHVGDDDYIAALESLATTDEKDRLVVLFNSIKDKRKPLYYVSTVSDEASTKNIWGSSYDQYKGFSYRATLGDIIRFAENENNTFFLTIRGGFQAGTDTASWSFYQAPAVISNGEIVKSSINSDKGTNISADEAISTGNYTKSLFEIGSNPGTYSIGLTIFQNAYRDLRNTALLEEKKDSLLYMNIFGDIVLSDNTVIVPGAANPLIYNPESAYNPYTVVFMNSYPRLAQDADSIRVQSKTDFNKYMLFCNRDLINRIGSLFTYSFTGNNFVYTEEQVKKVNKFEYSNLEIRKIQSDDEFAAPSVRRSISIYPFFYGGENSYYSFIRFSYSDDVRGYNPYGIIKRFTSDSVAMTFEQTLTNEKITLFPYHKEENNRDLEDPYKTPQYIAQNMYWYFTNEAGVMSGVSAANTNLRSDYIYENLLIEMLQGSEYVSAFEKNISITDILLDENNNLFESSLKKFSQILIDNIKEFDGVLGISSADSNPIFGKVIQIFKEYSIYIFAFFIIIFIFRYMKRGDFLYTVSIIILSNVFLFVFIYIFPSYLPVCYNSVGSLFTEGLVSDTLLYKAEKYSTTYGQAKQLNIQNDYDIQTVSITLYKMSEKQLRLFSEQYNVDYDSFRYGDRVIIDPNIGLFIQGDSLKINIDILLANNPVYGKYIDGEYGSYYRLASEKKTSSVMDFYCPYFIIEDGFVETLNSLLKTYNIPRTTADYVDGLVKDSYIVFNYTNSIPFLNPDNMEEIMAVTPVEYFKLGSAFPNPKDFLNISDWVNNPTPEMQNTLWYRTMIANGFYDPVYGNERRQDLISYVNYHTKRYLIENEPIIGLVSDENIIKITSLQATFFFNTRISEIGRWVYPTGYNQEELKLNDVFLTALTANNERFVKHNFNIVNYVANSYGSIGLIFFILLLCFSLLFVIIVKFSFPTLYIILALLIIYRMITDHPISDLMKGYAKVTLHMLVLYTIFIIMLAWIPKIISGITMLVALAILSLILLLILITVLVGVFTDSSNLGNYGVQNALTKNIITRPFIKPAVNLVNHVTDKWGTNPQFDEYINHSLIDNESIIKSKRHYIINSLDDEGYR